MKITNGKNKYILIIIIIFIQSVSLFSRTTQIKRNYYGLLVYSRNTKPGAKMAVHLLRKTLEASFAGFYSSHVYDTYKIASYFPGNKINKKNFNSMQKKYPDMNYFVTARIYYPYSELMNNSKVKVRISVYKTGGKVKRLKHFFITARIKNYNALIVKICHKISRIINSPWVKLKFTLIENDAGLDYSKARYYYENKKYDFANKNYSRALSKLNRIDPEITAHYVKSLDKTGNKLEGLKSPGQNSNHDELAAAYLYFHKKNYKRSLRHALAYYKNNEKTALKINKTMRDARTVFGEKYFAIYSGKRVMIMSLKNKMVKKEFKLENKVKTIAFNKEIIIINGMHYNVRTLEKIKQNKIVIEHKPLTVTHKIENGKNFLVHLRKKTNKTEKYVCGDFNTTRVYTKKPLFVVISGERVFVFGMKSGSLIWKKKIGFRVNKAHAYKNKVVFYNNHKIAYYYITTGRLIYAKNYKNAKRFVVKNDNYVALFKNMVIYKNVISRRNFKKVFRNLHVIDVRIHPLCLNVIVSDNEAVSYRYTVLKSSKIVYRKIYYGNIIAARYKHGLFYYNGYLYYKSRLRNNVLNSNVNALISKIYYKLGYNKQSFKFLFLALLENPSNFSALKRLTGILKIMPGFNKKLSLLNAFSTTHGFKFKKMPELRYVEKFIHTYFLYLFYKNGYHKLLRTMGYKVPARVLSLGLGAIKSFRILKDYMVLNLKNDSIQVLNIKTGKRLWGMQGFKGIGVFTNNTNQLVLFSKKEGMLICVDSSSGRLIWTKKLEDNFTQNKLNFYFYPHALIAVAKKKDIFR